MSNTKRKKLKVAFVVQRNGAEVMGGAERYCFAVAEKMKDLWDVEILTTCAIDQMTWDNFYSEGAEVIEGVPIRRFRVDYPRDMKKFKRYYRYLYHFGSRVNKASAEKWIRLQGPVSSGLLGFIEENKDAYDKFIFVTYLYATTYFGLPLVSDRAYLIPTAHDEWPIHLPVFDELFSKPRAFAFGTEEEKAFLKRRFPNLPLEGETLGLGINIPEDVSGERFRKKYGLTAPYILYIGRIEEDKGCGELFSFFASYKNEKQDDLKLVLIGNPAMKMPKHKDIMTMSSLDEQTKFDAIQGSECLINPSFRESLSIVLLEAWGVNTPTLVNARCLVLLAQSERSGSGLWYNNYHEFAASLDHLRSHRDLGSKGRRFVEENYSWEAIKEKYLRMVET